ncbi:Glycoside hydrolase, family 81 [Gigaspora margarita]|uniref:glucan endo-1,3-beta-D-glucosidase n=1 Tax=Gigaspora margarita TaxID=4874 RepID=A0A8H3X756_GIGMA|nr:Glycoside hydrolase, family 81 [Gigaspora margarita]
MLRYSHIDLFSPISIDPPFHLFERREHIIQPTRLDRSTSSPIQTNKFYENLMLDNGQDPIWPLPYGLRWERGQNRTFLGFSISHVDDDKKVFGPDPNKNPVEFYYSLYTPTIVFSAKELESNHELILSNISEFSSIIKLFPYGHSNSYISFPISRGMSFITAEYKDLTPLFYSESGFKKIELLQTIANGYTKWKFFLKDDSVWLFYANGNLTLETKSLYKLEATSGQYSGIIQITKVPAGNREAEVVFDNNVGTYPIGAELQASADGTYTFNWKVGGKAIAYLGNTWSFIEPNLPTDIEFLPANFQSRLSNDKKKQILEQAKKDLDLDFNKEILTDSIYFSGKRLSKFALLCLILNKGLDEQNLGAICINKLKKIMDIYTQNQQQAKLVYDTTWKGIVCISGFTKGANADFGNTWYNDHHFHYGYLIYAAAILRHLDKEWGKQNEVWVDNLIRDVANPSAKDSYFPVFRSFDWFNGHSWAKGLFTSVDGKDEESTSEDVNFYYATKLWSIASNRPNFTKLMDLILAILSRSLRNYFLIEDNNKNHPENFIKNKVTGILFENKINYTTYFSSRIESIHGIQMLPITPITPYTRNRNFVEQEWNQRLGPILNSVNSTWKSILYMNYATINSEAAYQFFLNNHDTPLDDGLSRTWALFWSSIADCNDIFGLISFS